MPNVDITEDEVIEAGGWHPAYAVVLASATDGDVAVALVAGNGPGDELRADVLRRSEGTWLGTTSWGAGAMVEGFSSGAEPGAAWAVERSRDEAGARVLVAYAGELDEVVTGTSGCWAWIRAVENPWRWGSPEVAEDG